MIGVSLTDFNINSSNFYECGWYLACSDSKLYSGPPHKFSGKKTNLTQVKDEVLVVMNMNNGSLKFIINNEDKGDSYTNIPMGKPITPTVILYDGNDSVEIIQC